MASLMLLGTSSNAGKSVLTAGLCRYFLNQGYSVAPFKALNMSNNSHVCASGLEISTSTAIQAKACMIEPSADMNPILLKPFIYKKNEYRSEVILNGRHAGYITSSEFKSLKEKYFDKINQSYLRLLEKYDLVLVEGAGSASEINLRPYDVANFGFASHHKIPTILIADIDRGGVIASIVGTKEVVSKEDSQLLLGFIINKFRGNQKLFTSAIDFIEDKTNFKYFGTMPYCEVFNNLPKEDSLSLTNNISVNTKAEVKNSLKKKQVRRYKVTIIKLKSISNFDEFNYLENHDQIELQYLETNSCLDFSSDLVILPGSKAVVHDLIDLQETGLVHDLLSYHRLNNKKNNGKIFAICGGYVMLGSQIVDQHQIESSFKKYQGLGLIDQNFEIEKEKKIESLQLTFATHKSINFEGYEIHRANTKTLIKRENALLLTNNNQYEGFISKDEKLVATFFHGLLKHQIFLEFLLGKKTTNNPQDISDSFNLIAKKISANFNVAEIEKMTFSC